MIGLALAAGVLVALERPLPRFASGLFFGLAALALGLDSAVENGTASSLMILAFALRR